MFRQRLVGQSSSGSAIWGVGVGRGFGQVRQLGPRVSRGIFNYNRKTSLTGVRTIHVLKPVGPYSSRWADSTPISVSRRPAIRQQFSLTPTILHTREYARRRAGPSPSVGDTPIIVHPEPPEPEQPLPDPDEFIPSKQIQYIERGFLAVFIVLYVVYEATNTTLFIRYKNELSKQIGEIPPEGHQHKISIQVEGLKDPLLEANIQHMVDMGKPKEERKRSRKPVEEPSEYDTSVEEVQIRLPGFTRLFKIMHDDFRFTPSKLFPIDGLVDSGFRPWTAVTSSLLHGNLFHLVACYFSLKVFTREIIFLYGPKRLFQLFFAGAGLAATLYAGAERLFTPLVNMTPEQQKRALLDENADPKERNAVLRYFTPSVGSSAGIIAIGTTCVFVAPWIRASLLLTPAFSIRTLMSILFAFDVGGQFFFDYGLGINHGGHLGGYAAGYILYRTMVKRWPYSRNYQKFLGSYYAARMPINMR